MNFRVDFFCSSGSLMAMTVGDDHVVATRSPSRDHHDVVVTSAIRIPCPSRQAGHSSLAPRDSFARQGKRKALVVLEEDDAYLEVLGKLVEKGVVCLYLEAYLSSI